MHWIEVAGWNTGEELRRKSWKVAVRGCVESPALCGVPPKLYSVTETSPSVPVCEPFIMFFYDLPVCISSSSVMLNFNKGWKNTLWLLVLCLFLPQPKLAKSPPLPWPPSNRRKTKRPNLRLVNSETFARCFKLTYFSASFSCVCLYISVCVQTHTKRLLKVCWH